jgi:choice-of-anchor B domain-containing protein
MRFLLVLWLFLPVALRAQLNLQLLAHVPNDTLVTLAGCWHHVDSEGREYALVGTRLGLDIWEVSQPTQPVRLHQISSPTSNWREVKTWNNHAYVGSEAAGSGITIIDLNHLPDSIRYKVWTGNDSLENKIQRSHTVLAQDGLLFIFGSTAPNDGAIICSLDDPWNPDFLGQYQGNYFHDGFLRGDILWGSEIYAGQFSVIDIADPAQPQLLATQPTPALFNHNTGLSDNSGVLFTTDEVGGAPLGAFDVSDLDNITLLDVYRPSQRPQSTIHNVRVVQGDFLVCPSYGGQLTIVDAAEPDNLIETAWYLCGTSLVWDADPYLPSGIVFATAKAEGLFIFQPTYQRASRLRGQVTDVTIGTPIFGAKVFIINTLNADTTLLDGRYATGAAEPGTYSIRVERSGYTTRLIDNVALATGQTTTLDVALVPDSTSSVRSPVSGVAPTVWPTVARSFFWVKMPSATSSFLFEKCHVAVYDPVGRLLLRVPAAAESTEVAIPAEWPAGNYRVALEWPDGRRSAAVSVVVVRN